MTPAPHTPEPAPPSSAAGDELLIDGQEEVFSRTEVESGHIEHHSLEEDETFGGARGDPAEGKPDLSAARPSPSPRRETDVDPDEAMAENFRSAFNPRP